MLKSTLEALWILLCLARIRIEVYLCFQSFVFLAVASYLLYRQKSILYRQECQTSPLKTTEKNYSV